MAKLNERKYGPKPGVKKRDHTSERFVSRKAKFGDRSTGPKRPTSSYVPKSASGIRSGVSTGYTPRRSSGGGKFFPQGAHSPAIPKRDYARKMEVRSFKSVTPKKPRVASASWGEVASWYDKHLNEADTYHEKVIRPNVLRLLDAKKGERVIDLACGQGYLTRALSASGAEVVGVDIAPELIDIAKAQPGGVTYHVRSADDMSGIKDHTFNKALITLAIQNIENISGVISETERILVPGGELHIVMNHPAFRIPKASQWGFDDRSKVQYRRVDAYLSNSKSEIAMHPGFADSPLTISYHRPLQFYFKILAKHGFAITRLEEWISHKESDSGPRAQAENVARKEIPLFLYLKATKFQ